MARIIPEIDIIDDALISTLELDLTKMLSFTSQNVLEKAVPCLVSVLNRSGNTIKLEMMAKSCTSKISTFMDSSLQSNSLLYRCLLVISLVHRYYTFDDTETRATYEQIKYFCEKFKDDEAIWHIPIRSLGFLFLGTPSLMVLPDSFNLMHEIFNSSCIVAQSEIVRVFVEYLEGQNVGGESNFTYAGKLDINHLIGSGEAFADAGIPTAIMQTFMTPILDCVLSTNSSLYLPALRAVILALEQGLVHPILCIPAICALESNPDPSISRAAFQIHQKLHEKHSSFIHTKIVESIQAVHAYQVTLNGEEAPGCINNVSLIESTYSLISLIKKQRKIEFLKNLVSLLEPQLLGRSVKCNFITPDLPLCEICMPLHFHPQLPN